MAGPNENASEAIRPKRRRTGVQRKGSYTGAGFVVLLACLLERRWRNRRGSRARIGHGREG